MNRLLTTLFLFFVSYYSFAQTCPGDLIILEDENLSVWKVESNGTQVFSLAGFVGTINIGDSTYFQEDIGLGETALVLMAHDITGGLLWSRKLSGISYFTFNPALTVSANNVYVAATSVANGNTINDLSVEAYSGIDGSLVWSNSYITPITNNSPIPFQAQVNPYAADLDGNGRLILTGTFSDSLNIGGIQLGTTSGTSETFVMALDEFDGTDLWATQSTGSTGRGRAWTVAISPTNEIVLAGRYTGSISFGGTPYTAADNTIASPYIAKLDPLDGSEIWLQGFEGQTPGSFSNIYDIDFDTGGNIFYAGSFRDAINVQGNLINSASTGNGSTDALIGAMDTNGNFLWANQLGGPSTIDEYATTIVYSASATALYIGAQLVTDSLYYGNTLQVYPPLAGHYVYGVAPIDGSIDPNPGNNISAESNFGYSAQYDDATDTYFSASLIGGNGKNVVAAQWIPNRPIAIADITTQTGVLDPTETLTAYDPSDAIYTFQWYKDGVIMTDSIANNITVNTNGSYYVEVSGSGGCAAASEAILLLDGLTLESDSLALVELYNKTDGANWTDNGNWLVSNVNTWNNVDVVGNRVTALRLTSNNLTGNFPQSITNLSELTLLELGGNFISGTLPNTIGNLDNLTEFAIWGNQMSGSIPSSIGDMASLSRFYVTDNSFSGPLPNEIGNLTALEGLAFNNNQITGPLPASIGNLTAARYIEFNNNPINDAIPAEIGSMQSLQFIQMENALLTGSIPVELGNLTGLIVLNVGNNQLTGAIPIQLGALTNLQELTLFNNALNTSVPTELSSLISLTSLNLENCQLQGTFPDAIWRIPTLTSIILGGNTDLEVLFPSDLATFTQLVDLRLDQTLPRGGAFPTDLYSLTNLVGLSLGNKGFTGTLDGAGVDNWTQLDNIYLWNNDLSGDLPTEFTALPNLRALNVDGNKFQNIPDFSSAPLIEELSISRNQLDFNSIVPNLSIPVFNYDFQNQRANQYLEVDEGGSRNLINSYTANGNQYQWVRNTTDSIATTTDYTISSAKLSDLGGYFAYVTNPAVPDFILRTPFYNVAFSGAPKSWTVDNQPGSVANFKTLYAATYGTNAGDTLYVMGSDIPYNIGGKLFELPRVIYGPGYFLSENPETQAVTDSAFVNQLLFKKGAEGSVVSGLNLGSVIMNNQASAINDTLTNVTLSHNRIDNLSLNDDNRNHTISKNFIGQFNFASTPAKNTSRSYQDITISNNIIDTVTTFFARATAERNDMTNIVFDRNTIGIFTDSIEDVTLTNNIINVYQGTANTVSGTLDYAAANFENNSGTLSIDNDFQSAANAGAFSGPDPYVLSGIAPIPHIYTLNDIGRIRINVQAKNESNADINFLNYRLGEGGSLKQKGTVRRLVPGNPVEVLFRPKLGKISPGATISMMIWPKDANGVRGVPQRIVFTAETTTASGQILTSTGAPVTNGEVLLFEINQEATAFDTLSTILNNQGNFTFSNIVIGDYLALGKPNSADFPGQLPTYFQATDLWEEADTLLIEANNPNFNISLIEDPKEETGLGIVAGFLEEELDQENSGGRIEARGRVRAAGVSMRRARRTGRGEDIVYDLVQYVFTNDNGEFIFENLPADNYRINIQYPGYPMDTLTNIDLVIEDTKNNNYSLEALVDEGKISVTILSTTGVLKDLIRAVNIYPNPSVENINILFNKDFNIKGNLELELISTNGQRVFQGNYTVDQINKSGELTIPVSQYQNGTYLLRLKQRGLEIGTIRIMVSK